MEKKKLTQIAGLETASDSHSRDGDQKVRETISCRPDEMLDQLTDIIRKMPDIEPPVGLLPSVMEAVATRKISLWKKVYRWVRSPRSITFTPLQLVPALALSALIIFSALHLLNQGNRGTSSVRSPELIPVLLSLNMPNAHSVQVIGSFNNWIPLPCEMKKENGGTLWTFNLRLPPGRYEYVFVVDGKMIPDPNAEFYRDDGFGNQNTVLSLGNNDEAI